MSRRKRTPREVDRVLVVTELLEHLVAILETVSPREREVYALRFGLYDNIEHSHEEIARRFRLPVARVWQIEGKVSSKIRHPSRSMNLQDFLDMAEFALIPDEIRRRILPEATTGRGELVLCGRHGYFPAGSSSMSNADEPAPTCQECPCLLTDSDEPVKDSRPRIFCSNACRQAAYRRRRKST